MVKFLLNEVKGEKLSKIVIENFDCFNVHRHENGYSFVHLEIEDSIVFYEKLFDYFFDEQRLIKYCEHNSAITFSPSQRHYAILYKHLKTYIDEENLTREVSDLEFVISEVMQEEMETEKVDGKVIVRLDKIGKIGEYIFCCVLSDYFKFDCIIPKVHLQTDFNMNVYGIDTLFYSRQNNLLMFGESKLSLRLENGIKLINASLKEYEEQLETEFQLVLSNRLYKNKLAMFDDLFGENAEISLDIHEFVKRAGIRQIGIPIFIAHGEEIDEAIILEKLKKIDCQNFLGLDTQYYLISLPVVNKKSLVASFTKSIREKEDSYVRAARK